MTVIKTTSLETKRVFRSLWWWGGGAINYMSVTLSLLPGKLPLAEHGGVTRVSLLRLFRTLGVGQL